MSSVQKAASVLMEGGIVIFPTDTVYAVGCLIEEPLAIERLYKVKERDRDKPTLVLAESLNQAKEYAFFDKNAEKLAETFWPGPLTIVIPAKNKAPEEILGKNNTIGIRVPREPVIQELLKLIGIPILAPSANIGGRQAAVSLKEIDKKLTNLVDYVLEFPTGGKAPSTIVEVAHGNYRIVRTGPVSEKEISEVLSKEREKRQSFIN